MEIGEAGVNMVFVQRHVEEGHKNDTVHATILHLCTVVDNVMDNQNNQEVVVTLIALVRFQSLVTV